MTFVRDGSTYAWLWKHVVAGSWYLATIESGVVLGGHGVQHAVARRARLRERQQNNLEVEVRSREGFTMRNLETITRQNAVSQAWQDTLKTWNAMPKSIRALTWASLAYSLAAPIADSVSDRYRIEVTPEQALQVFEGIDRHLKEERDGLRRQLLNLQATQG